MRILQLLYEPPGTYLDLQIDLLLGKSEYHRHALERRVPMRLARLEFDLDVLALKTWCFTSFWLAVCSTMSTR